MKTSNPRRRKWTLSVAALLLVVAGGCSRVSNVNGEQVFEYEPRAPLTTLLVGLAATPIGWTLRKRSVRLGWGLIIFGPILAGIVAPSMFVARVVVGADQFQVRNGFWWASHVRSFKFAEIDEIGLTSVTTVGRRGRKRTNHYLSCYDKSGRSNNVSIDNPVTRAATGAILREAVAHGIRIRGAADGGIRARGSTGGRDW